MQLHSFTKTHARPKSRRIGRGNGSAHGNQAGRGTKGQKARTGANSNIPRTFIGGSTSLIQRLPKLKGFTSRATRATTVNMARIAATFSENETISIVTLLEKGLISVVEAKGTIKVVGSTTGKKNTLAFDMTNPNLKVSKKLVA